MFIINLIAVVGLMDTLAQENEKNVLKIKGKVLVGKKADITVFQKVDNDWVVIKTMKSKAKYSIELSPEENYYVVFISNDGIKKALYVEGGKVGNWAMHLNLDFNEWSVKYATLYQHNTKNYYKLKTTNKKNLAIKNINENIENTFVNEW